MLKKIVTKKKKTDETALKKEEYFSQKAFEIYAPKYTSSFSENHRNYSFLGKILVNQNFEISKKIMFESVSNWFEGKTKFTGDNALQLGTKFSLTLQGSRQQIVVTELKNEANFYSITFFNELKNALMWNTFYLSKQLFFGKKYFLGFRQEVCFNATQDPYSPQGLASRFLVKRNSKMNFELFAKDFNAAKERFFSKENKHSNMKK